MFEQAQLGVVVACWSEFEIARQAVIGFGEAARRGQDETIGGFMPAQGGEKGVDRIIQDRRSGAVVAIAQLVLAAN